MESFCPSGLCMCVFILSWWCWLHRLTGSSVSTQSAHFQRETPLKTQHCHKIGTSTWLRAHTRPREPSVGKTCKQRQSKSHTFPKSVAASFSSILRDNSRVETHCTFRRICIPRKTELRCGIWF